MCEQCESDTQYRVVRLELEDGRTHHFCSDGCEHRWMAAELVRQRRFLNRIYVLSRGKAQQIAKTALTTSRQPWQETP